MIEIQGKQTINNNGWRTREFVAFNELKVTNTFYRTKAINKYTWLPWNQHFLIHYIIDNQKLSPCVNIGKNDHHIVKTKLHLWARWKEQKAQHDKISNHNESDI